MVFCFQFTQYLPCGLSHSDWSESTRHYFCGSPRRIFTGATKFPRSPGINYSLLSCCSHVVVAWQHKQVGAKRSAAFAPKAFMAMAEDSEKKTKPILIAARERGMKI